MLAVVRDEAADAGFAPTASEVETSSLLLTEVGG